jgi:Cu+-exporting ATPase
MVKGAFDFYNSAIRHHTVLLMVGPSSATENNSRNELRIGGMTCANCARHVTEALQGAAGVAAADVSLQTGRAHVRWHEGTAHDISILIQAVEEAGYHAAAIESTEPESQSNSWSPWAGWKFNVIVGGGCTLILLAGEWIFRLGTERWFHWLGFALAMPVQILCGARFYRGAWNQLRAGGSNMDTLVALGSTTAFAYSVWGLLRAAAAHLYFMEAAAIITLISVGHWLEGRASEKAAGSLRALLDLAPARARKKNADGTEMEIAAAELRPQDLVLLKPGDRVPTDGQVIEGGGTLDESMLTGESLPVSKKPGEKVYAGTLNVDGQIIFRVTAAGDETALAQIIAAVQRAQNSRAEIQRLADRVSNVFVPIVVLIAVAAALWWGLEFEQARRVHHALAAFFWPAHLPESPLAAAMVSAAAVLIVACPCAMGLATPIAIMTGANAAARRGILIRDGIALERAGKITTLVFDKTGTLTTGRPEVAATKIFAEAARDAGMEIRVAAALARASNHPFSRAVAKLDATRIEVQRWQELRGLGVEGHFERTDGAPFIARLGSTTWMAEAGMDLAPANFFVEEWTARGATILVLAMDGRLAALFALRDSLKPGAAEVVKRLRAENLSIVLITGDNRQTALAIAAQAGIEEKNVYAQVRPEAKAGQLKELQARGERVAFVGDGINDAPALEQADLGIAVSQASDVAREAADIILLKSEIGAIPEALGLARATLRTIKQNLFWAFFYNALGVPLAALGFLSPVLCAAAMGLSDLVVIGNALRLRGWKLPPREK